MANFNLNSQQQRLLIYELNRKGQGSFSIPMLFEFHGKLDLDILAKSIDFILKRHEIFNLKIDLKSLSFVKSDDNLSVELIKIEHESEVDTYIRNECEEKLSLDSKHLYRFSIIESPTQTYLFFNIHHIIWDGTSTTIFLNELKSVYESLIKGKEPGLKEAPSSRYDDYIARQKEFQKLDPKGSSTFFKALPNPEIPTDKIRESEDLSFGGMTKFKIPKKDIERYCRSKEISPYTLFASVFGILINRYSGLENFNLGVPLLGRYNRDDLKSLGFYANTSLLPINIYLNSIEQTINDNSRSVEEHRSYSKVSFEKIKELTGDNPFSVFYMYQDFSLKKFEIDGIKYERKHLNSGLTHGKIDLWIANYVDHIEGGFHFCSDLYLPETIKHIQEDFLFILDETINGSVKSVGDIGLSKPHKKSLEVFCNAKKAPVTASWLDEFQKNVQNSPGNIAIKSKEGELTYEELDIYSSQVAAFLHAKFSPPQIIAVELSRSPKLVGVLLGILKAGFSYLPIDPLFPADRIHYMKKHAKAAFSFTDSSLVEAEKEFRGLTFVNNHENSLTRLAYVIFTSGSTGLPKGVEISLRAMTNFLLAMKEELSITNSDTLCAVTTLSFDISVLELFLPLVSGAQIYLANSEQAKSPEELSQVIESHNISYMQATPTTWKLLLSYGWHGSSNLNALCGGERLPYDLVESLNGKVNSLWNMYGPTETTVWSTLKKINLDEHFISVGKPIANTQLLIKGDKDNEPPLGAVGELLIGGHGLAKGYLHDPHKTKDKFVELQGRIFYKTGDLARFCGVGDLQILGRNDSQVKVRGFRIELEEIEYKIKSFSGIKDCVCAVVEGDSHSKILAAFCVIESAHLDEKEIRTFLKKRLPGYMIPDQFKIIKEVPLTPNNKVDRSQLSSQVLAVATRSGRLPETEIEKKIAAIWKVQLKRQLIYKEDNFFEIGGNSMTAMRTFHELENCFHCNLELSELFTYPHLEDLALRIEEIKKSGRKAFSNLVQINQGNKNYNIFFFHAIGGNILNYKVFVDTINDYNCYGLQSTGVDGHNIKMASVKELAKKYAEQILKAQLHEPYILVGGSMGGILAYEVAAILSKKQKRIERVIMFDTAVPTPTLNKVEQSNRKIKKGFRSFGVDQLKRRFLGLINKIFQALNKPLPMIFRGPLLEFYNFLSIRNYTPVKCDVDLYLIRIPIKSEGQHSLVDLGWGQYTCGNIEVDFVDAPHDEFVESPEVAKIFSEYVRSNFST